MLRRPLYFESEHSPEQCATALQKLDAFGGEFWLADYMRVEIGSPEADYPFTITHYCSPRRSYYILSRVRGTIVYDDALGKTVVRGRAAFYMPRADPLLVFLIMIGILVAGLTMEQNRCVIPFALVMLAVLVVGPFADRGHLITLVGDSVILGGKRTKPKPKHQHKHKSKKRKA